VGNTIRTGIRSMTEIKYDDGTLTRIGSRSNITINDRKILINKGYIWGKVNKDLTKGLKIFTSSAVVAIVGTEFFVEVNSDKSTTVTVLEGIIEVTGKKSKIFVVPGTYSRIYENGTISEPENFKTEEVFARYSDVTK
ncbi:MAG: FecR domain-containing protein, partial [Candidatus Sericytochromatia bacterium]|nr:FecR domain-containing protein [Candidatus Sericytochromatia bacterium]